RPPKAGGIPWRRYLGLSEPGASPPAAPAARRGRRAFGRRSLAPRRLRASSRRSPSCGSRCHGGAPRSPPATRPTPVPGRRRRRSYRTRRAPAARQPRRSGPSRGAGYPRSATGSRARGVRESASRYFPSCAISQLVLRRLPGRHRLSKELLLFRDEDVAGEGDAFVADEQGRRSSEEGGDLVLALAAEAAAV